MNDWTNKCVGLWTSLNWSSFLLDHSKATNKWKCWNKNQRLRKFPLEYIFAENHLMMKQMWCFSLWTLDNPSLLSTCLSADSQSWFYLFSATQHNWPLGTKLQQRWFSVAIHAAESTSLPWSVTAVGWKRPRKSAPAPVSPHYLLHTGIAPIQNGDPQLQSLHHHGAHLTCWSKD